MRSAILLCVPFVLLLTSALHAQPANAAYLKSLSSVRLLDIRPREEILANGIETKALQTRFELRLRQAGLKILNEQATKITAALNVRLEGFRIPNSQAYAMDIILELTDTVPVVINGRRQQLQVTVWTNRYMAALSGDFQSSVSQALDLLTDALLNDILAARQQ